jgi:hypothetical protein
MLGASAKLLVVRGRKRELVRDDSRVTGYQVRELPIRARAILIPKMKTLTWMLLAATPLAAQPPATQPKALLDDYFKANISGPPEALGLDPFYKKYTSDTHTQTDV